MRYGAMFGATAAGLAAIGVAAATFAGWAFAIPFAWGSVSFALAALAYAGLGAGTLGKRADGALPLWSRVAHGPFLLTGLASMRLFHAGVPRTPWHEVGPGVLLGRRPTRADATAFAAEGFTAIVDLCAELPATRLYDPRVHAYLALPVLDHEGPTTPQLDAAIAWIERVRADPGAKVLVHCALGRGRSATVVAAWWIARGDPRVASASVADVDAVEAALRNVRPISLSDDQRAALGAWWAQRDQRTRRPSA